MFAWRRKKQPDPFDFRAFAQPSRAASRQLLLISNDTIDAALLALSAHIQVWSAEIVSANEQDVEVAKTKGMGAAMIERLTLDPTKVSAMAKSLVDIAALPHPAGIALDSWTRPNGLIIEKTAVPIGVLGMIYESRPNVTLDAAALCLKSRNAVILRGGSEAFETNKALHKLICDMLKQFAIPETAVLFVPDTDRAIIDQMLICNDLIDVLIPRGGKGLTGRVMSEAKMPVFAHLDGNCHVYIHESADPAIAHAVTLNAKLRRTGICGAAESLLIDEAFPEGAALVKVLLDQGCAVVGDKWAQLIDDRVGAATDDDWRTEYLDKKISVKVTGGVQDAIDHINYYGSHHTDAIIATDEVAVQKFTQQIDSAIVLHNASTQFADGGEFGFGAEIGIGTGKLHARGPVGLQQLCTFKYVVRGTGQIRA